MTKKQFREFDKELTDKQQKQLLDSIDKKGLLKEWLRVKKH